MANPYESPTTETSLVDPPITDAIVRRLIDGDDTETLAFYDVSDCQIYGRKHRRRLGGPLADDAKSVGCSPTVYQTILWFCIAYIPVWPMGTYFVMPFSEYDESDDEAVRYRGVLTTSDPGQIALHYSMMFGIVCAIGIAVWCWWL